jgi:hypothetical protein
MLLFHCAGNPKKSQTFLNGLKKLKDAVES